MKGTCRFCGQMRIVSADVDMTIDELNELASEECDCEGARLFKKRRTEAEVARENVDNLFADHHPCAAAVLKECIELVQDGRLKEVNLKITPKVKAQLKKTNKDSIQVNKTVTTKEELDTE